MPYCTINHGRAVLRKLRWAPFFRVADIALNVSFALAIITGLIAFGFVLALKVLG